MRRFGIRTLTVLIIVLLVSLCGCKAGKPSETIAEDGIRLSDDSSDFVLLIEAVPDAILEIRYYSTYPINSDSIKKK